MHLVTDDPPYAMDSYISLGTHHGRGHRNGELDPGINCRQIIANKQQSIRRDVFRDRIHRPVLALNTQGEFHWKADCRAHWVINVWLTLYGHTSSFGSRVIRRSRNDAVSKNQSTALDQNSRGYISVGLDCAAGKRGVSPP